MKRQQGATQQQQQENSIDYVQKDLFYLKCTAVNPSNLSEPLSVLQGRQMKEAKERGDYFYKRYNELHAENNDLILKLTIQSFQFNEQQKV